VHVAVVYEDNVPYLYLNGLLVHTGQQSSRQLVYPSFNFTGYDYGSYQGYIDEMRIWSEVRTQQQIADNRYGPIASPQTNLSGYWPVDAANPGVLLDLSGNGRDVTMMSTTGNSSDHVMGGNGYRYGFNGKEKSSEITSDDYDFGARIYDGRIGRWLSTDIVTKPFISPYNFAANNPVNYLDPNGEDNIHFYYVIVRQYADGKLITSKPTKFYTVEKTNTANVFVHHKYELRYDGVGSDGKATSSKVPIDTRFYPDVPGSTSGLTSSYGITDNDRKTLIKFIDEFSVSKQSVDIDYTELNSPGSNGSKRLQNAQWWDGVFKEKAFLESQEQEQNNRASFVIGVIGIFGGEALLVNKILGKVSQVTKGTLSFGNSAKGHLIKHADVLGFGNHSPQQLQKMMPELENAANNLFGKMKLERVGKWSGFENAKFYIGEGKMMVTQQDGTFITTINKTSNAWFKKATPVK